METSPDAPKFILCPDCKGKYDDSEKRRVIDSCGHPRCFSCLFAKSSCPLCKKSKTTAQKLSSESDENPKDDEKNGFLRWRPHSSSFTSSGIKIDGTKHELLRKRRSTSLAQLEARVSFSKQRLNGKKERGSDFGRVTQKSSEILEQEISSRPGTPATGVDENEATKPTTTSEAGGKIDRKLSFSSILNRNSESYKQSRFRRAASISFIPKEANNMDKNEQGQFESRVRIPCRRRPKSFNSFEYGKFNSTACLPSTAENSEDSRDQLEIRRAESLRRICELENVVDKAAAWLAESKSFIQKQYFPMPTESTRLNTCCEEDVGSIDSHSSDADRLKRSEDSKKSKGDPGFGVAVKGKREVEESGNLDIKESGLNEERRGDFNKNDVEYGIMVEGICDQAPKENLAENAYDEDDSSGARESLYGQSNRIMERKVVVGEMNLAEQNKPVIGSCKETDLDEYAAVAPEFFKGREEYSIERNETDTMELSSEEHLHSFEGGSSSSDFVNNEGSKGLAGDSVDSEVIPHYICEMESAIEDLHPKELPCFEGDDIAYTEQSTKDPSYIPAIRELIQGIESRRGSTSSEDNILEPKSMDFEEKLILSPRKHGIHANPYEELANNGRIGGETLEAETRVFTFQSVQEVCDSDENECFERKGSDFCSQQKTKLTNNGDKQHQSDHNSSSGDKYKQTEDTGREYTETTTWNELLTGDNLHREDAQEVCLADIPPRQIPDEGCNGKPMGRALGNMARAGSDITSEKVNPRGERVGDGRRKLSRRPFSTSDLGRRSLKVKLTEIHYLPSLKKTRRKRPTSASNLQLEWDSSISLKEINVDEYNDDEALQKPPGEVDGLATNTDSNIEKHQTRNSVGDQFTGFDPRNSIDNSEVLTKAEILSIEIPNNSFDKQGSCIQNHGFCENGSFNGILKIDSRQAVDEICGESGDMTRESRFTDNCLEIDPYIDEDGASKSNGIDTERVAVEEDEITEKFVEIDELSNEMESGVGLIQSEKNFEDATVEAIMINKTDDWKTENFHKIRSKTKIEGNYDVENGASKNKTKEDGSKASEGHFGSAWFKDKAEKGRRKMLKQRSEEGYKSRGRYEVAGKAPQRRVSDGLGFIRNKFQKFAKWSKRGSVDSNEISEPKSLLGHPQQQSAQESQMKKDERDMNNDIKDKDVVCDEREIPIIEEPNADVNQNVVVSTDLITNFKANRGKRRLKFDDVGKNSKDKQHNMTEVSHRKTSKKHDASKIKELIIDKNKREEKMKARTAKIIQALKGEDELSLTTVSALSTTNQTGLPLLKDLNESYSSSSDSGDSSDFNHHSSDSSLNGHNLYSSGRSSSSDTINESVDESQMPDFRSPSRIQDDLAILLERKVTRKRQGLQEIDFHPLMPTSKGKTLVSRDWLYERVHHHLVKGRNTSANCMLISGKHGSGKTTFLKTLVWNDSLAANKNRVRERLSSAVLCHHFCSKSDTDTTTVAKFVLNMAANLVEKDELNSYTKILSESDEAKDALNAEGAEESPEKAFREGILKPLNEIHGPSHKNTQVNTVTKRYLILVDVADHHCEACKPDECIAALLAKNLDLFPSWITVVVAGTLESLHCLTGKDIDEVSLDNVANWDVQSDMYSFTEMALHMVAAEGLSESKSRRLLDNIVRYSKGSFHVVLMAIQYVTGSFSSPVHTPSLSSLDVNKLISQLFRMKFGATERRRVLAMSLLDVLLVSQELFTVSNLFKVVENSCSSQQVAFQEYETCLEKLLETQMVGESIEGRLYITNIMRKWLQSKEGLKLGFTHCKGHNLLSIYYMKTLSNTDGKFLYRLAYHLASSSFGEDIKDPESRMSFLAWTFNQVFKDSFVGFMQPCNIYHPYPDVYHLFLHIELDMKSFKRRYKSHPLVLASSLQQPKIVSLLLDHKQYDKSVIHEALEAASRNGNTEIVQSLLSCNVEILAPNPGVEDRGTKLITIALENHYLPTAMQLLKAASVKGHLEERETSQRILCEASRMGKLDIVKELLEMDIISNLNELDSVGNTPLVCAAKKNRLVIAKHLVESEATIDVTDKDGMTPLIAAAKHGHVETAEWLISQDANVDAEDCKGRTALIYAAARDLEQFVHTLFMEGASLDHQDHDGLNALFVACKNGCNDTVKCLLKNRASTEIKDNQKKTPLHYACENGELTIAQMLLEHGASINHKDENGAKPLERALSEGKLKVAAFLLKYGAHVGRNARNIAERNLESFLCLISHLEQRGNIMIKAGKFTDANADFQRAINIIETSQYRNNKKVIRVKLLCKQDPRTKFF